MLDLALLLAYVAALVYVALRAFARPDGVYWRSAAGVGAAALGAALIWQIISPSPEAGFGASVLWAAVVALATMMALAACIAATVRHVLDALAVR